MAAPVQPAAKPAGGKRSILFEKKGPLPVWAWALILLGVLLAWSVWRRNKTDKAATATTTGDGTPLPGDQTAPPVFIVPPATPPPVNVTVPITTVPTAPPGAGSPPPVTPPSTPGPKPAPPGLYVTVAKYTSKNPPWNSTLWGIWNHYKTVANWQAIWNHPLNADLRTKRGAADRIQPGDRVFVPGAK